MSINYEEYLEYVVRDAIRQVIREGAKKPRPCHWVEESQRMHIEKGVRHAMTYLLETEGQVPLSGENHLKLALTRFSMALVQDAL